MDYSDPLDLDWSTEEMVQVVRFFEAVEQAYETSVSREVLMEAYRQFKVVVPSKAEEKTIFRQFEKASSYSCYHAVKLAKERPDAEKISMDR